MEQWFWCREGRWRVTWYDATQWWGSTEVCGSMTPLQELVSTEAGKRTLCISLYDQMRWKPSTQRLPSIYTLLPNLPLWPLNLSTPQLSGQSPSSLYLCSPSITQFSARLTGGNGGEKRRFRHSTLEIEDVIQLAHPGKVPISGYISTGSTSVADGTVESLKSLPVRSIWNAQTMRSLQSCNLIF